MTIVSTTTQTCAESGAATSGSANNSLPMKNIRVEVVSKFHDLMPLRSQWDAVYAADSESQFFLSWSWMAGRLQDLGTSWFVLVARAETDPSACTAFLPMRVKKTRKDNEILHELRMAGNPVADYAGFICRPEQEKVALAAFSNALKLLVQQIKCDQIIFLNIKASKSRLDFFMSPFAKAEYKIGRISNVNRDGIDNNICPYVNLPDDWDTYLMNSLSSNMRQKLRRLTRKIEESTDYKISLANSCTIENDVQTLLNLWELQWGARKIGIIDNIRNQLEPFLMRLFKEGNLFVPRLEYNFRIVGLLAIFLDHTKKSCLFSIGGRDPNFQGQPPGLCLHAFAIRYAIAHGFKTYDFLKGDEAYKFSFGAQKNCTNSFIIKRATAPDVSHPDTSTNFAASADDGGLRLAGRQ